MRVNVTYSVELGEVLELTKELLSEAHKNLNNLTEKFLEIDKELQDENEKKAASAIEDCRKLAGVFDHHLFDCQNILAGYQKTLLQIQKMDDPRNGDDVAS